MNKVIRQDRTEKRRLRSARHVVWLAVMIIAVYGQCFAAEVQPSPAPSPSGNLSVQAAAPVKIVRPDRIEEHECVDISRAVYLALKKNVMLRASYEKVNQAGAALEEIKSRKRLKARIDSRTQVQGPPINFDINVPITLPPPLPTKNIEMSFEITKNFNAAAKLVVEQIVSTFGKIENETLYAFNRVQAEEETYESKKSDLVFEVKSDYFNILKAQTSRAVAEEYSALTQEYVDLAKKLHKEGVVSGYDVLRAELAATEAKKNIVTADKALDLTKSVLLVLVNQEDSIPFDIQAGVPVTLAKEGVTLESLQENAVHDRYEIRSLNCNIAAAKAMVEAAKSLNNPDLVVSGEYLYQTMKTDFYPHYLTNIGFSLRIPICNGGETKAKVKEAESALRSLELGSEGLRDQVKIQVKKAWLDVREASAIVDVTLKEMEKSKEGYRLAKARYTRGVSLAVEMDAALTACNNSKKNLNNALYDLNIAVASLEKAVGRDVPKEPIPMPDLEITMLDKGVK